MLLGFRGAEWWGWLGLIGVMLKTRQKNALRARLWMTEISFLYSYLDICFSIKVNRKHSFKILWSGFMCQLVQISEYTFKTRTAQVTRCYFLSNLTAFVIKWSAPYGSIQDQDFKLAFYFAWGRIWEGHQTSTANRQCRFIILHFAAYGKRWLWASFSLGWYLSEVTSSKMFDCSKNLLYMIFWLPVCINKRNWSSIFQSILGFCVVLAINTKGISECPGQHDISVEQDILFGSGLGDMAWRCLEQSC